jgi:hypothetical protein
VLVLREEGDEVDFLEVLGVGEHVGVERPELVPDAREALDCDGLDVFALPERHADCGYAVEDARGRWRLHWDSPFLGRRGRGVSERFWLSLGRRGLALLPLSVSDEREVPEMFAVFLHEGVCDSGGDLGACCVDEEGGYFDLRGLEEREGVLCEAEDEGAGEGVFDFWDARVEHRVSAVHGFVPGAVGHVPL